MFASLVGLATAIVPVVASADWLTYHLDNTRTGNDTTDAAATTISAAWTSVALDGAVYAEPLVSGSMVLVATEHNSIYALDAGTGDVLWQTNLGAPVPGSSLPCGNINPVGITGTPVIDGASGTLYAAAMLSQPSIHYELFAVTLSTGAVAWHQSIEPAGFDPLPQGQRGALALANGNVYVPYGGRFGDCGQYTGWVVGLPAAGGGTLMSYQLPIGISGGHGGGLWTAGGLAVDGSGNVYGVSGNSSCGTLSCYDYSEADIKLSPTLGLLDYFTPSDWVSLNNTDSDLGGTGPGLLPSNLLFQVGKSGAGYLVLITAMGGIGGQKFTAQACPGLTVDAAFGGVAYAGGRLFVPCSDGIEALTVNLTAPSFTTLWHGPTTSASGPPIVAGGLVWTIDPAGTVYALDPATGSTSFSASIGGAVHFATPAAGDGRVFLAAGTTIRAFALTPLPALRPSPRSLTFGNQAPGTTSPPQMVTVTNTGNASLTINTIAASGDFGQTNTCGILPATVAAGGNCSLSVTFTPTVVSPRTGAITITDNATGSPHSVALSGNGSFWGSWSRIGASASSAPAVSSWGANRLDLFARGQDMALYHAVFNGSWNAWTSIPASMTSAPAAVSWGLSRIDVFGRGSDNALYHTFTTDGGTTWAAWSRIAASMTSAPAVASWGSGRLDVFGRGQDYALYHISTTDGGTTWSAWERLGASMTSDPAAVSWAANRIDVVARGGDMAVYQLTFDSAGWHSWVRLGGNLASAPAISTWGVNRLDVFAQGLDLAFYHLWTTDGTTWNPWERIGGSATSGPAAVSWGANRIDVFGRGQDLALYQISYG